MISLGFPLSLKMTYTLLLKVVMFQLKVSLTNENSQFFCVEYLIYGFFRNRD